MNCPKCKMEMVAVTGADGWFCVLCSIVHATVTVDNNQAKREAGMKLRRNLDTLENRKFWSNVDKARQNIERWPEWKRKVMLRKPALDKGGQNEEIL